MVPPALWPDPWPAVRTNPDAPLPTLPPWFSARGTLLAKLSCVPGMFARLIVQRTLRQGHLHPGPHPCLSPHNQPATGPAPLVSSTPSSGSALSGSHFNAGPLQGSLGPVADRDWPRLGTEGPCLPHLPSSQSSLGLVWGTSCSPHPHPRTHPPEPGPSSPSNCVPVLCAPSPLSPDSPTVGGASFPPPTSAQASLGQLRPCCCNLPGHCGLSSSGVRAHAQPPQGLPVQPQEPFLQPIATTTTCPASPNTRVGESPLHPSQGPAVPS